MTPDQLAAIRARAEKAVSGPWIEEDCGCIVNKTKALICHSFVHGPNYSPTRSFIAHSREDVPALITAYENASADLKEALNALRMLHDNQNGCPLEKYEKDWNEAMALTERILEAHSA